MITRADLDHEHDRVADLHARVELLERGPDRRPQDLGREQGLRTPRRARARRRGGGLRWRSSVQGLVELGRVHARLAEHAEEAAVGVVVDELVDSLEREVAHARRRGAPGCGVVDRDVRVDARAGRGDGVRRDGGVRRPGLYGPLSACRRRAGRGRSTARWPGSGRGWRRTSPSRCSRSATGAAGRTPGRAR